MTNNELKTEGTGCARGTITTSNSGPTGISIRIKAGYHEVYEARIDLEYLSELQQLIDQLTYFKTNARWMPEN